MPTTNSIAHELWTADEFLEWLEPGVFADLIDGEILMHSPVSLLHANLANFLDHRKNEIIHILSLYDTTIRVTLRYFNSGAGIAERRLNRLKEI
jgi:hypothetical protein